MKKKPMTQAQVDALQAEQESLVGEDNGITATTWVFCWKCGKKLNVKNRNEITSGVHSRCSTETILEGPRNNRYSLRGVGVVIGVGVDANEKVSELERYWS